MNSEQTDKGDEAMKTPLSMLANILTPGTHRHASSCYDEMQQNTSISTANSANINANAHEKYNTSYQHVLLHMQAGGGGGYVIQNCAVFKQNVSHPPSF